MGYRSFDRPAKTIVWYLLISALTNLVVVSLAMNHFNNMPVFHVFTVLEFIILTLFFRELSNNPKAIMLFNILLVAFPVFAILNTAYIQPIHTYNSISRTVESLLLIGFSLASFYTMLGQNHPLNKQSKNLMWINAGMLCYFSGSLFLFIFSKYIMKDVTANKVAWIIHAVLVAAFLYTMITVYLIKSKNQK